jgi:uncharacterized protein (TIGR00369 family)
MTRASKTGKHPGIEELRARLAASKTAVHFGFEVVSAEPGHVVLRMRVGARHLQIHGVVHGGVLASLADTAGGFATYTAYPHGVRVATVEMKINYLEAVERGTVEADGRVLRSGKHISVVDCEIRDENRRLVGQALMTFFVGPLKKKSKQRDR